MPVQTRDHQTWLERQLIIQLGTAERPSIKKRRDEWDDVKRRLNKIWKDSKGRPPSEGMRVPTVVSSTVVSVPVSSSSHHRHSGGAKVRVEFTGTLKPGQMEDLIKNKKSSIHVHDAHLSLRGRKEKRSRSRSEESRPIGRRIMKDIGRSRVFPPEPPRRRGRSATPAPVAERERSATPSRRSRIEPPLTSADSDGDDPVPVPPVRQSLRTVRIPSRARSESSKPPPRPPLRSEANSVFRKDIVYTIKPPKKESTDEKDLRVRTNNAIHILHDSNYMWWLHFPSGIPPQILKKVEHVAGDAKEDVRDTFDNLNEYSKELRKMFKK